MAANQTIHKMRSSADGTEVSIALILKWFAQVHSLSTFI